MIDVHKKHFSTRSLPGPPKRKSRFTFLEASTVHCLKASKQARKDSKFLITKSSGILGAHLIDLKRDEYG